MDASHYCIDYFTSVDEETYNRFIALRPTDCGEVLEELRVSRSNGIRFESPENRVFGFGNLVLKFYRPGRWSIDALNDELQFLEDLQEADVPFVRPIGKIGTWKGMHYLAFQAVPQPYMTDPEVLSEEDVRKLVQIVAQIHDVGELRDAKARPRFNAKATCEGSFGTVVQYGYLPRSLWKRYERAIDKIIELSEDFGTIPMQRVHGDSYSGNALWTPDGPILLDLDDFQVGPTAMDIALLSFPWRLDTLCEKMERKERRAIQHRMVLAIYREFRPYDKDSEALIPLTRACRNVTFDAWMSARWNEPGFNEYYEDDDLLDSDWWIGSIEMLERAELEYKHGWP